MYVVVDFPTLLLIFRFSEMITNNLDWWIEMCHRERTLPKMLKGIVLCFFVPEGKQAHLPITSPQA